MMQSNIPGNTQLRSFFPDMRAALTASLTVAALLMATIGARAQATTATPDASAPAATQTDAPAQPQSVTISNQPTGKTAKKGEKVVQSKDTKKENKIVKKDNPLEGMNAKLPDKALYDKAMDAMKHGRFDVARLDLQTLLNTYQDSQFEMRAKLAIADSWYKEGGTAALTQAEQEYRDFIVFYPNVPEAAEAQMRIGDIYFREMDKPDRDHSKAVHAEEEYRLMLQQFPDSTRVPEAAQRLRVVQESLASAEADVAAFYATHGNLVATIARYQTVADTYPLYSHMDDVLVGLGDAYEAQARYYRGLKQLPEGPKARLVKLNEDQAAAAYRKVVLEHSAAPHVEDARDRLAAMNLPIPTPTPEQMAASAALENSRGQYTLSKRVQVFVLHQADTVPAATIGAPPLEDPKPTYASSVVKQTVADYVAAFNPAADAPTPAAPAVAAPVDAQAPATPAAPANAPLIFQDVPTVGSNGASAPAISSAPVTSPAASSGGGTGMGIEIVQPSSNSPAPAPTTPGGPPPAFPGAAAPTSAQPAPAAVAPAAAVQPRDPNYGLTPVGPSSSTSLAPIEKAPDAPVAINEATPGPQPATQAAPATGKKKPKPAMDKTDDSSSKKKPKKGLGKLNPF
jgi:outer membrane protein assembly factor BamD